MKTICTMSGFAKNHRAQRTFVLANARTRVFSHAHRGSNPGSLDIEVLEAATLNQLS